eukprot:TRINITY_DN7575_c0_g1_i1.p2 TRINITY_DN7575_c0_g1~~TRINITY_DN7575_c0_g1_i1.p2  ORF type:complete len:226 (+),score=59.21 TRINITY_DN7575_c0_g1_i1:85-678(+)
MYLGAAHGVAGILYMLLYVYPLLSPGHQSLVADSCALFLHECRDGTPPAVLGDPDADLVHWCHGAPGAVPLLLKAHAVLRDDRFLHAAARACETIWRRGLLRKGVGLCHGIAGNAYAFLAMYRHTRDNRYLHCAWHFCQATWDPAVLQAIAATPDPHAEGPGHAGRPVLPHGGHRGAHLLLRRHAGPLASAFPAFEL